MIDFNGLSALLAVLVSFGALILAWRKAPTERRATSADAGDKISDAALQLLEPMKVRINELEAAREHERTRMSELERRVTELECELREERIAKAEIIGGANRLVHQVESMGGNPVYRPPRGTGELKAK